MKITLTETVVRNVKLPKPEISHNNRLDSEPYYQSGFGARTDIAVVQFYGICNVFFGVKGIQQIDLWDGITIDDAARKVIINRAIKVFKKNTDAKYIQDHIDFFKRLGIESAEWFAHPF